MGSSRFTSCSACVEPRYRLADAVDERGARVVETRFVAAILDRVPIERIAWEASLGSIATRRQAEQQREEQKNQYAHILNGQWRYGNDTADTS